MHILNLLPYGPLDYLDVDAIQREIHRRVASLDMPDTLIAWESQPVYTAGRRTADADIPDRSVPVLRMDRGGSVTYHGPGQLIVYPIVRVRPPKDVVRFVRETELAIGHAMLATFGITTSHIEGRSGAWIVHEGQTDRKLCAIGMKFSRDTSMHGLALNVCTDLSRFHRIVACGLADADVASLKSLGVEVSLTDAADALLPTLSHSYQQFSLRPDRQHENVGVWEVNHPELLSSPAYRAYEDLAPVLPQLDAQSWIARAPQLRASQLLPRVTGTAWEPRSCGSQPHHQRQ